MSNNEELSNEEFNELFEDIIHIRETIDPVISLFEGFKIREIQSGFQNFHKKAFNISIRNFDQDIAGDFILNYWTNSVKTKVIYWHVINLRKLKLIIDNYPSEIKNKDGIDGSEYKVIPLDLMVENNCIVMKSE